MILSSSRLNFSRLNAAQFDPNRYSGTHEGYRKVRWGEPLGSLGYSDLAERSFEIATISSPDYAEG